MKYLDNTLKFFAGLGSQTKLLILSILIIGVLGVESKCTKDKLHKVETELQHANGNIAALNDSLRISKTKTGEIEYNKLAFISSSIKELSKVNAEIAEAIKETKGNIALLTKTNYKIVHDTVEMVVDNPQVKDGVVVINGHYDTTYSPGNYRYLSTRTNYSLKDSSATESVTRDEIGFTALTGLKKTKTGYEIFVQPKYPAMSVVALEGAVIDKNLFASPKAKAPLITLGLQVGWAPYTYDIYTKKGDINLNRIAVGAGINFNLSRIIK
jgi:hypothetical protein